MQCVTLTNKIRALLNGGPNEKMNLFTFEMNGEMGNVASVNFMLISTKSKTDKYDKYDFNRSAMISYRVKKNIMV